jgi:DNA-binding NarL/FixJ family response regulator
MIRLVIADDHTVVLDGLDMLLESFRDVEVVGRARDGEEALRQIEAKSPDVVLMDVAMPGLNGIEAARRAAKQWPHSRILMLSMHADEAYVYESMRAGASGYLLKGADREELEHAIRVVAAGETYITPAVSSAVVDALAQRADSDNPSSPLDVLTSRQREILQLIAEGVSTKQIAVRLHLSAKTVESHRANLMARLGIRDVPGLVRFAMRTGLISTGR